MTIRKTSKKKTVDGLRDIVKERISRELLAKCCDEWEGWMVLIVDNNSMRVISNAIGMYNLMEHRVNLVEHIDKKRAPYRQFAPIYFLTPSTESVKKLIDDYTLSGGKKEPHYADNIFLYFSRHVSPSLFAKIKACKGLVRRLKAFGEVNIDFLCTEMRNFHFDMKSCFKHIICDNDSPTSTQHLIAEKLVTVCASLNEYPHIRYRETSKFCTVLAQLFHHKLKEFISTNESWWYHGDLCHREKGRSTLLLLSRTDDLISPLIHEFTYQAMVHDLLDVQDDKITYRLKSSSPNNGDNTSNESIDRDVLLNEDDELWVELRGQHIAEVSKLISTRIREIVYSDTGMFLHSKSKDDSKSLNVTQVTNTLKALPEYREVISRLAQHLRISHQCFDIFNKQGLMELSDLEQTLATNKMEDGSKPNLSNLLSLVEAYLSRSNDIIAKLRLLAIVIGSQNELRQQDQDKLFVASGLQPKHINILKNLQIVGKRRSQKNGKNLLTLTR